ncbi:MAG: TatD family hydrolase [Candidatus Micrarchaeaceae archaeon]
MVLFGKHMHGTKTLEQEKTPIEKTKIELADSHCHLDMLDTESIKDSLEYGVSVMISNGGSTKSNLETLKIADKKHIFAAVGISPDYANIAEEEIAFNLELARSNREKLVAIGEVGLDLKIAKSFEEIAMQRTTFARFVDLAEELGIPVCVHSRNSMDEVLSILESKNAKKVQLHFFEGDTEQAKKAASLGYFISVPPVESSKRSRAIKDFPIEQIMAESDAPAAGAYPKDVERSVMIVAKAKGLEYEKAAEIIASNTKRFFNIGSHRLIRTVGS